MREFNTLGPVYPDIHYHVDRVAVKADLREKIEKGRYITLNAARQAGKSTLFEEIIAELEATGDYFGILIDFESLRGFEGPRLYEQLSKLLAQWRETYAPSAPEPTPMRDHGDFIEWLQRTVEQTAKRGVLIIDEFETISADLIEPLLSLFRGMYLQRRKPNAYSIHSIILVGVRTIPSLLGGTQSPFNIADQFAVPYFTPAEVTDLLTQHTAETGQIFEPAVMQAVIHETEGQPYLVNRLGQILTEDLVRDRSKPVTSANFDIALAKLVNENNTHFASIQSKAAQHRAEVIQILFSATRYYDFRDEVTQELLMYGVLRLVPGENGVEYARIANPIYGKVLVKAFAPRHTIIGQRATHSVIYHHFMVEGRIHFDKLMDSFKAFMEEYGVRLLKSEATSHPLEISGQYLLLSYLTAAFQSSGGYVTIESLSSAGEMDILAFHQEQRFIVETKIWYSRSKYEAAKLQLAGYLKASGLPKGYMVIFDEQIDVNPLLDEGDDVFEVTVEGKTLRIYLVGVSV
jgi:hypothetical protein